MDSSVFNAPAEEYQGPPAPNATYVGALPSDLLGELGVFLNMGGSILSLPPAADPEV